MHAYAHTVKEKSYLNKFSSETIPSIRKEKIIRLNLRKESN